MEQYIDSLKWRYAAKKYDADKKVSEKDLEFLKEAVQLSVSSSGLQPYRVLVIENKEVKEALAGAAYGNNQQLIKDAPYLFVFANIVNIDKTHVDKYMANISDTRNVTLESLEPFSSMIEGAITNQSTEQNNNWTAKQVYIALSSFINAAAVLKIDATPMEGFNPAEFNRILNLDELGLNAAVIAVLGYRHEEDSFQHLPKVRKPKDELFITIK